MPSLLPFRALYPASDSLYIPGEELPRETGDFRLRDDETQPALYLYRQQFGRVIRDGVIGLLHRAEATVFPHEETCPDRVAECRQAIGAGQTDPGSIWLWCHDEQGTLAPLLHPTGPSWREATDRFGVLHRIWRLNKSDRIAGLQAALEGRELFLADGHHRFECGWNLASIQIRTSALRTLPAHRLAPDAAGLLLPEPMAIDDIETFWNGTPPGRARFGLLRPGEPVQGIEIPCGADETKMYALHQRVIGRTAVRAVRNPGQPGEGQAILLVEPVEIDELERNARRGILLPPKSTDFWPKLAAGLVRPV